MGTGGQRRAFTGAALAAALCGLAACANVEALRADPAETGRFSTAEAPARVVKNIERQAAKCQEYWSPVVGIYTKTDGRLVGRLRPGATVTVTMTRWTVFGSTALLVADITAAEHGSEVAFYRDGTFRPWRDFAPVLKSWVDGAPDCVPK